MFEGAKVIGPGTATISLAGAAIGIGNAVCAVILSLARNLALAKRVFGYALLGISLAGAATISLSGAAVGIGHVFS